MCGVLWPIISKGILLLEGSMLEGFAFRFKLSSIEPPVQKSVFRQSQMQVGVIAEHMFNFFDCITDESV